MAMSLKGKVGLGVVAATALLAGALTPLAIIAKGELDEAAEFQHRRATEAVHEYRKAQLDLTARTVAELVAGSVEVYGSRSVIDLTDGLRNDDALRAAYLHERDEDGELFTQTVKEPREGAEPETAADRERVKQAFETRRDSLFGDIYYLPYFTGNETNDELRYVLRLKLKLPELPQLDLPNPDPPSLAAVTLGAILTLIVAMLAVFLLLMFALRKLVISPLGNVLEDSRRIVKGAEGLEVKAIHGAGGGDIETLVAAFNAMFAELKDYQADLEGKVKEATSTIERQQQSLVIAQRLAATGTLAAGLAHEVNNPLSGMLNAVRRLRKREGLDERSRDYVDLMEEGLRRIEKLMKQILEFSRRRDMKPERFDIKDALAHSLELVRHRLARKEIRLEEDVREDVPELYGNEEEIGQVFMNLLINAADAAPQGGEVRVSVAAAGAGVRITVEDSGQGIEPGNEGRIFDPFFTTKEPGKGTGLGLSIVHTIVDNHGGSVRAEGSDKLGGARFVVELPTADSRESGNRS